MKLSIVAPLLLAFGLTACPQSASPADAGDGGGPGPLIEAGVGVGNAVCTFIEGVTDNGVVRTICATVDEVGQLIAYILTLRSTGAGDGGAVSTASCTTLPGTSFCATKNETAQAIAYVYRLRQARLLVDAGAR